MGYISTASKTGSGNGKIICTFYPHFDQLRFAYVFFFPPFKTPSLFLTSNNILRVEKELQTLEVMTHIRPGYWRESAPAYY